MVLMLWSREFWGPPKWPNEEPDRALVETHWFIKALWVVQLFVEIALHVGGFFLAVYYILKFAIYIVMYLCGFIFTNVGHFLSSTCLNIF